MFFCLFFLQQKSEILFFLPTPLTCARIVTLATNGINKESCSIIKPKLLLGRPIQTRILIQHPVAIHLIGLTRAGRRRTNDDHTVSGGTSATKSRGASRNGGTTTTRRATCGRGSHTLLL